MNVMKPLWLIRVALRAAEYKVGTYDSRNQASRVVKQYMHYLGQEHMSSYNYKEVIAASLDEIKRLRKLMRRRK